MLEVVKLVTKLRAGEPTLKLIAKWQVQEGIIEKYDINIIGKRKAVIVSHLCMCEMANIRDRVRVNNFANCKVLTVKCNTRLESSNLDTAHN